MTLKSFRRTILAFLFLLGLPVCFYTGRLVLNRVLAVTDSTLRGHAAPAEVFEVVRAEGDGSADIRIPLPEDVLFENVSFENRYLEPAVYLSIQTAKRGFYVDHAVSCDTEKVPGVTCCLCDDGTIGLLLKTDTLYEPSFRIENEAVYVSLARPYETAEHVIVLDPAYNGAGGDVSLSLAQKLRQTLEASTLSCKVYLTRTGEEAASDEALCALLADAKATRLIRLVMPEGEAALSASAALYDGFFIRGYGNVPFAADLMWALSTVEGMQEEGVFVTSEDPRLSAAKIPAVSLHIEGVRSSFGEDEKLLSELATALEYALRKGYASGN